MHYFDLKALVSYGKNVLSSVGVRSMHARRRFLSLGAAAGISVFAPPSLWAQSNQAEGNTAAAAFDDNEVKNFLARAERLGVSGPVPAGAPLPATGVRVAETILRALEQPENSEMSKLAEDGSKLLRERSARDGFDRSPDEPEPAAPPPKTYPELKKEYGQFAREAEIDAAKVPELRSVAGFVLSPATRDRYIEVETATNRMVPWFVVGALHYREASLDFMGHLHNGDSLLKQTVDVPKDRPPRPWPPTDTNDKKIWWLRSAIDALDRLRNDISRLKSVQGMKPEEDLKVEQLLYVFETYNGFGCRSHDVPSPYLWNYTNKYARGGFPSDHHFEPSYVSKQAGLFAIIKTLGIPISFDT